jgi:p24 family protein gamma-2
MKQFIEIIIQILAIVTLVPSILCEIQREMTLIVAPKTVECLYEDIPTNFNIEFEYQVIDGGQGELDINFYIALGEKVYFSDVKSSDNFHRIENEEHDGGNFKFCFDNSISHFNSKTVFFELVTEDPENPQSEGN